MMSPGMIERIRQTLFGDARKRKEFIERFEKKNRELEDQLKRQQMTPEILEKRCTL